MRRAGVPMQSLGPLLAGCLGGLATCIAVLSMPDSAVAPPVELSAPEGREPAVVAALRAKGARVLSLGKRGGLDGRLVEPADGDAYSLYLTPDGHAVAGLLYGPDGALLTGRQLASAGIASDRAVETYETRRVSRATPNGENSISGGRSGHEAAHDGETDFLPEYVAGFERPGTGKAERGDISYAATFRLAHADGREPQAPDKGTPWDAEALFARSHSAFDFSVGRSGPAAVVFADPACRWSRAAVTRLARAALDGRLRLRVIPVGVLGAASAREAAAVASARDPALAWFEGAPGPASPEGGRRIALNNTLFDAWGAGAVPLIAWRARDGRVAQRVGDVEDVDAWLEGLTDE